MKFSKKITDNISAYDFHDGSLIDIKQNDRKIEIFLESAQIHLEDIKHEMVLSIHNTIRGKLSLEEVSEIYENEVKILDFSKRSKEGEIYDFEIKKNIVFLTIIWHADSLHISDVWCRYSLKAKKIYWENIPDLPNPLRPD